MFLSGIQTIGEEKTPPITPKYKRQKRQNKESKNNPEEKTSVFVIPKCIYQESEL